MLRAKHVVSMKHCWEVDIRLSKSAKHLTLDDLEEVISMSQLKMARIVFTPTPRVPVYKMFAVDHLVHVHHDLWPWMTLQGLFQGQQTEIRMWCLIGERWIHACYLAPSFIWWPWPWVIYEYIWVIYGSYMVHIGHIWVIYVIYGSYMGHILVIYGSYMVYMGHIGHICVIYGIYGSYIGPSE